jgi:ATP/maltotriose-dependent transcriptional regulator MalT
MSDAAAHIAAAQAAREAGDRYDAAQHQRRAVALLRGGDPRALAHAIRHLAEILVEGGKAEDAAGPVSEMLALTHASDIDPLERANVLRCAALQAAATGDDETARTFWIEARTRYAAAGATTGVTEADARIAALRE